MELNNFHFKKQFGQNFIFDKNYISSIITNLNLNKKCQILEIGAGAGVLTEVLADNFSKVISFEIDKTLISHLENIKEGHDNLNFIYEDILKVETSKIDNMFDKEFILIANLPYYITSQIIFKFLFESKKINSMYVMVQKEVGERFCAKKSTKAYGIPTVTINTFGSCEIVKNVPRTVFTPVPNVDSCVICIKLDRTKFDVINQNKYLEFVSNCFKMKRKTLYNNLTSAGYNKQKCLDEISNLSLSVTSRPENLEAEQFVSLFKSLNY